MSHSTTSNINNYLKTVSAPSVISSPTTLMEPAKQLLNIVPTLPPITISPCKTINIVKRLEELNKWQDKQKRRLEERQNQQRQLLGMEAQSISQVLGTKKVKEVKTESIDQCLKTPDNLPNEVELEAYEVDNEQTENLDSSENEDFETDDVDDECVQEERDEYIENEIQQHTEQKHDNSKENTLHANAFRLIRSAYENKIMAQKNDNHYNTKQKRPFLKRGEGLKQRFKMDPNEFRLNNLPRYKYSNAHPHLLLRPPNVHNRKQIEYAPNKVSSSIQDSGSHVQSQKIPHLDVQERRFQQMLITSKNVCNSTPEIKSILSNKFENNSNSIAKLKQKELKQRECIENERTEKRQSGGCNIVSIEHPPTEGPTKPTGVSWSKVLDPHNIKPMNIIRDVKNAWSISDEDIFELLEQKAEDGSVDINSSSIKQFMERRILEKLSESDVISVGSDLKNNALQPLAKDAILSDKGYFDSVGEELTTTEEDSDESGDTSVKQESNHMSIKNSPPKTEVRVRFTDFVDSVKIPDNTINDNLKIATTDDDKSNNFFQQFREALFSTLHSKFDYGDETCNSISDTTLIPNKSSTIAMAVQKATIELQEKTDIIKIRLTELEREINTFKENNVQLMKAKQEHELEKNIFAQEQLEMAEKLKDEKIQIEIYLHDERMKLEDEKHKFEQNIQMKNNALLAKERKEVEKLREQISHLEGQMKNKDSSHMSAQGRLRTQMRNLEREQKKLHEEIERLTKENKRLENENMKISREQNNKLLQEINRNIAKLAPKMHLEMESDIPKTLNARKNVSQTIVATALANRGCKSYKSLHHNHKGTMPVHKYSHKTYKKSNIHDNEKLSHNRHKHIELKSVTETDTETSIDSSISDDRDCGTQNSEQSDVLIRERSRGGSIPTGDEDDCIEFTDALDDEEDILTELQPSIKLPNHTVATSYNSNRPSNTEQKHLLRPNNIAEHTNHITTVINEQINQAATQQQHHQSKSPNNVVTNQTGMKREIVNDDGSKDIWYPNGNLKKISPNGMLIRMLYFNKDIKETNINEGTVKYYYAESNTWHTTYLDGLEVLEFPNGQIEHRHKNGMIEVHFPNNSVRIVNPNDEEKTDEWRFPDGSKLIHLRNGSKILFMANGQKEIHTKTNKRREYPDGTTKILYMDGTQETRYSNGRVRLKDKDGKLVMDTMKTN